MALNINGTTGISGVDGSNSSPAIQGSDSNTGLSFASDTVNINTGGTTRATVDSSGNLNIPDNGKIQLGTGNDLNILHTGSASEINNTTDTELQIKNLGNNGILLKNQNAYPIIFQTSAAERMRIDSSGKVGIGEASPLSKLHIKTADTGVSSVSGDANEFVLENTGHCGMTIQSADDGIGNIYFGRTTNGSIGRVVYNHASNYMYFQTNAGERMRIHSGGQVSIGHTSGTEPSTNGILLAPNGISGFYTSNNYALQIGRGSSDGKAIQFNRSGINCGHISVTTSSTSYNSGSDYRLKENVIAISDGITRIKTLKPSRFNFKVDATTTVDGFLAHEVTAVPEAITGTKDEVDSDNNPVYQGIDQSKLVPLLTAALQEAIAKIEILETKVAALEAG